MLSNLFRVFEKNDEEFEDEDEIILEDLSSILINVEDSEISLPPHYRCASHTLSLVAVSDCEEELLSNKAFKTVLNTCKQLWKKQNKTTTVAEKIHETLGVYLMKPNLTRYKNYDIQCTFFA